MRTQSRTRRISKLAILAVLMALPIFTGSPFCSEDDEEVIPPPPITRSSPDELLENWFENAYSRKDSVLYEQMLDTDFQFEFLLEDAELLQSQGHLPPGINYWGKTSDLSSTGAMFGSENVTDVTLNVNIDQVDTNYADPGCPECVLVQTHVDLNVTTIDPNDPEPLTYVVLSPQDFVVRPDPDDPTLWVVYRQNDKPREGGKQAPAPVLP
jgi:hypothetical protein